MGCSQNYGSLLAIVYITAPTSQGCQNGTLILGTTRIGILQGSRIAVYSLGFSVAGGKVKHAGLRGLEPGMVHKKSSRCRSRAHGS